jgi:hypothetical protein
MSKYSVCASAKLAVAGVLLALWSNGALAASVVVMDTSLAGMQRGQELMDEQQLNIPSGDHLLVGVVQDGQLKQIDIRGPRTGKVKDLLSPEPTSTSVWQMIVQLARTGGASQGGIAASRGLRLTLNDVPIRGDVAVCIEENSAPKLAIASGDAGTLVRLSDNQGTQSTTLNLPLGSGVAWPSSLPLKDGDVYRVMEQSNPQIELKVRIVPKGSLQEPVSLKALETLVARGCEQQAFTAAKKMVAAR